MKWLLPFPDIFYPKDIFPLKIKLPNCESRVTLVEKSQSLAESPISSEDKFILNGQQLQDSGKLGLIGSGSELCLLPTLREDE